MIDFLETLKRGMRESQGKFQAAQAKLQAVQAEFQKAAGEFQAWQTLVNLETAKANANGHSQATSATPQNPAPAINNASETNKTEVVREVLRQHPAGMTPGEIWKQLATSLSSRAYLYSILKRLRDKGDARERRGKYFLNPKPDENQAQVTVI